MNSILNVSVVLRLVCYVTRRSFKKQDTTNKRIKLEPKLDTSVYIKRAKIMHFRISFIYLFIYLFYVLLLLFFFGGGGLVGSLFYFSSQT